MPAQLCVTSGHVTPVGGVGPTLSVADPGMRAVVAGDVARSAEVAFTYVGPSPRQVPLASGEMRLQVGLKLRAQDTCNVVYVMWHVAPMPGIFASIKRNPGQSLQRECGDSGYINLRPSALHPPPAIAPGEQHTLHAEIDGNDLVVVADGARVWEGTLPDGAFAFDGPPGVRTDNVSATFELRVPRGSTRQAACPSPD
jgi:hypothetical protein